MHFPLHAGQQGLVPGPGGQASSGSARGRRSKGFRVHEHSHSIGRATRPQAPALASQRPRHRSGPLGRGAPHHLAAQEVVLAPALNGHSAHAGWSLDEAQKVYHARLHRKATITLQRDEWEELVMEQIARLTDKVLVTEDLALACRWHLQRCPSGCFVTDMLGTCWGYATQLWPLTDIQGRGLWYATELRP